VTITKEQRHEYNIAHREYAKAYYIKNRDRISERSKVHHEQHRDEILAKSRSKWAEKRSEVMAHYGNRCACCGESTPEFLSIDHINGGGRKHRKEIGSGNMYRWIIDNGFPDSFQILCHNCNQAKGYYGECPHKKLIPIHDYIREWKESFNDIHV
jgi:hypothetical protein